MKKKAKKKKKFDSKSSETYSKTKKKNFFLVENFSKKFSKSTIFEFCFDHNSKTRADIEKRMGVKVV